MFHALQAKEFDTETFSNKTIKIIHIIFNNLNILKINSI